MMFYKRPAGSPSKLAMHVRRVRWVSLMSLVLYPAGCLMVLAASFNGDRALEIAGLVLILLAVLCFALVVGTGVQRILGESRAELDELEIQLREKAYASAYHIFAGLVSVAVLYVTIASGAREDLNLWIPSNYDQWTAVLWGVLLSAMILPTAVLAWRLPPSEPTDDEAA